MKTKKDGRSINRDVQEHLRMQGIKLWKKKLKLNHEDKNSKKIRGKTHIVLIPLAFW